MESNKPNNQPLIDPEGQTQDTTKPLQYSENQCLLIWLCVLSIWGIVIFLFSLTSLHSWDCIMYCITGIWLALQSAIGALAIKNKDYSKADIAYGMMIGFGVVVGSYQALMIFGLLLDTFGNFGNFVGLIIEVIVTLILGGIYVITVVLEMKKVRTMLQKSMNNL